MVRLSPIEERLHSSLKDVLQSLVALLSPASEEHVHAETPVHGLLEWLDNMNPSVRVALIGAPCSGKSSVLNALLMCDLLPTDTKHDLVIRAAPAHTDMLLTKQSGKSIAKGFDDIKDHLQGEKTQWLNALADRVLRAPLPLFNDSEVHAAQPEYIDTNAAVCSFVRQLSLVGNNVKHPNRLVADQLWNCIDARRAAAVLAAMYPDEYQHLGVAAEAAAAAAATQAAVREAEDPTAVASVASIPPEPPRNVEEARAAGLELLYHVRAACNHPSLTPAPSLRRALSITTFVLTHIDTLIPRQPGSSGEERVRDSLKRGFQRMASELLGQPIDPERIIFFAAPSALATLQLLSHEKPSIQELYEYSESHKEAYFMQQIDDIEEGQLRRMIQDLAQNTIYERCGAKAVADAMRLVDANSARLWLLGIALNTAECIDLLAGAAASARPMLQRRLTETQHELTALLKELEWVVNSAQRAKTYCVKTLVETLVETANAELDGFLRARQQELRYVLEHRELEWFRERQAATVVEMNSSLRKLETFTDRYMTQRGFLEQKIAVQAAKAREVQAMEDTSSRVSSGHFSVEASSEGAGTEESVGQQINSLKGATVSAPAPQVVLGTNPFLEDNIEAFLDALEREKEERLIDFYTKVCYHVKDEYVVFLPTLIEKLSQERDECVRRLHTLVEEPLREAMARLGVSFDINAVMSQLRAVALVEENSRRLSSFLRELPEHVAAAAVEISNQWYVPLDSVSVPAVATTLPLGGRTDALLRHMATSDDTSSKASGALPSAKNIAISGGTATISGNKVTTTGPAFLPTLEGDPGDAMRVPPVAGPGGRTDERRRIMFPGKPTPLPYDANREPHHKAHPHVLYVYECWRLTSEAIELHQLSQYNIHDLNIAVTDVNNAIIDIINDYVGSLEDGIVAQKSAIQEQGEAETTMVHTAASCTTLKLSLDAAISNINNSIAKDIAAAAMEEVEGE